MNCFMGYNPLATKQVKVTVWVCEQDGATPVAPSNPSAGDCFIVYATDEAVLSNTPTSAKTYADGEWKDAEGGGGGGGFDVPTFALDERWSCDMTYEEAKASYVATVDENGAGLAYTSRANVGSIKIWAFDMLASGDALSYFVDVPETVNEGLAVLSESGEALTLFADDGNFYEVNQ